MPADPKQKFVDTIRRYPRRKRALTIGDSWFQYPLRAYGDLQRKLAVNYRTRIVFFDDSSAGRDARQLPQQVQPRLDRLARHLKEVENKPFDLILVSLGGNDVIGEDFAGHLKRKGQPAATAVFAWNPAIPQVVHDHIRLEALADTFAAIQAAYLGILRMRNQFAPGARVICHSYADVTPADAPYQFVGYSAGPWLLTPMRKVGLTDAAAQRELARWLLQSFENLLLELARRRPYMTVLKSRRELPDYRGWWDNEIHPLGKGFQHLVDTHWIPEIDRWLQASR